MIREIVAANGDEVVEEWENKGHTHEISSFAQDYTVRFPGCVLSIKRCNFGISIF